MALNAVTLDDKYALESGRVYLTGTQALVRLPMMQRQRDVAAGLNTGCFISGYRGSPLGGVDQQLWSARQFLAKNHIHFQPGVNEDLAATAVWGSQQGHLFGDSNYDGVYSMWYGKGPGVDRSGDVFRHGNLAGSAPHGGVLLLAGDDHTAKSSTTAHQCEYAFMDAMIPVLNPAGVQEFLDLGLLGWAMSRYSGCWVGFKTIGETVDSSASVYVDPHRIDIEMPQDFNMPAEGLNIRWPDGVLEQEERLQAHKIYAALAFARANKLDKTVIDSPQKRRLGIVTAGKSYLDVRQALDDLGIDEEMAADIGLSLYKVGMTWPLEREGMRRFAEGLEEIVVVEEKRAVIENQLKEQLYNWRPDVRPRVIGKYDEDGEWILPSIDEITPARIARVLAQRISRFYSSEHIDQRLAFLEQKEKALNSEAAPIARIPYFCSGCPHNTSTKVPEGSRAMAGIGCHYMAIWMDRDTETFTQMGGEGVPWVGQAPFSKTKHVFANLGDGTYFHSGIMAVRAAVAAKVNITYKVLYNDAVAMTGGQPHDGPLDPAMITRQLEAEGVKRIVVVTDEPDKYPLGTDWAHGITIEHRDELDRVQRDMREIEGVSVILYDQTCAAEKRRRRKRGLFPDPPKRVFINDAVCEGCGDCSVQSNCVSVAPLETEFGRKRVIDQSSCNKDFSCVKGFCPSFVTVHGGALRKKKPITKAINGENADQQASQWDELSDPTLPSLNEPYSIVITGVGGTGVVTIGALIGMAAHIEGKGCSVLDMAGLAQKGGAVVSHVRISSKPEDIHAVRVSAGGAKLLLGCDLVVAAGADALSKIEHGRGRAVINSHEAVTGEFTRNPDLLFPSQRLQERIEEEVGADHADFLDATQMATAILGDSIATNLFMLGYAWQKGLIPLSLDAIDQAIVLNGVAVEANTRAFRWGRRAAHDLNAVKEFAAPPKEPVSHHFSESLDELVERRVAFLTDYQDAAYAARYRSLVDRVQKAEASKLSGSTELTEAVARYYFKLLAIKDEYEVARLYSTEEFTQKLHQQFEGDFKLSVHLAPPIMAARDPESGHLKKREFGPWILQAFKLLSKFKGLRGSRFDIFGHTDERKMERQLIADYESMLDELIAGLSHDTHAVAVDLASVPEHIRGYGHVKERHITEAKAREAALLQSFRNPEPSRNAAE
ncbi:indolepyruvate ferredoxin oxidoreductase family protein [Denitrobaculum tricleocarpae]|uniref:Indolepyruvate ferredoxin oxidoreductase family protein n=1 Tax=Denitrobaculum tricleocarpae TaxID=2591009 RepID=A0A545TWU1_9PROT|nr:indolepyruvate ferredoxin oxidoreductase family protein [Denitrobaculum tricleocarpae]TQV81688.1 indolepyruvate ferredoxin oxidoreductase family protein [Denitrobaculum tricleocarpae]